MPESKNADKSTLPLHVVNFIEKGILDQLQGSGIGIANSSGMKLEELVPSLINKNIINLQKNRAKIKQNLLNSEEVINNFGDEDELEDPAISADEDDYLEEIAEIEDLNKADESDAGETGENTSSPEETEGAPQNPKPEQKKPSSDKSKPGQTDGNKTNRPEESEAEPEEASEDDSEPSEQTEEDKASKNNKSANEDPDLSEDLADEKNNLPQFPQDKPNEKAGRGAEEYRKSKSPKNSDQEKKEFLKHHGAEPKENTDEAEQNNTDDSEQKDEDYKPYDNPEEDEEDEKNKVDDKLDDAGDEDELQKQSKKWFKSKKQYERLKEKILTTTETNIAPIQKAANEQNNLVKKLEGRKKNVERMLRAIRARAGIVIFLTAMFGPIILILWIIGVGEVLTVPAIAWLRMEFVRYQKKSTQAKRVIKMIDEKTKPLKKKLAELQKQIQAYQKKGKAQLDRLNAAFGRQE